MYLYWSWLAVVISGVTAILGYWRANLLLFQAEQSNIISENEEEAHYMMPWNDANNNRSDGDVGDSSDESRPR